MLSIAPTRSIVSSVLGRHIEYSTPCPLNPWLGFILPNTRQLHYSCLQLSQSTSGFLYSYIGTFRAPSIWSIFAWLLQHAVNYTLEVQFSEFTEKGLALPSLYPPLRYLYTITESFSLEKTFQITSTLQFDHWIMSLSATSMSFKCLQGWQLLWTACSDA